MMSTGCGPSGFGRCRRKGGHGMAGDSDGKGHSKCALAGPILI